jgi:uncharacterized SAM-binding protein YcdF (DUF218 family)
MFCQNNVLIPIKAPTLIFLPFGASVCLNGSGFSDTGKTSTLGSRGNNPSLSYLIGASNGWVSSWLVRSLEAQIPPTVVPTAEAIVVLGGATKPALPPRPGVDLSEQGDRIFYAAQLYKQQKAPLIIVSGGRLDWTRRGTPESADMANILSQIGVPASVIIQEPDSLNTYENAVNVRKILNSRDIRQILLVTSAMHMPRSL